MPLTPDCSRALSEQGGKLLMCPTGEVAIRASIMSLFQPVPRKQPLRTGLENNCPGPLGLYPTVRQQLSPGTVHTLIPGVEAEPLTESTEDKSLLPSSVLESSDSALSASTSSPGGSCCTGH